MEREHDTADLIDLGQASVETKGIKGLDTDGVLNLRPEGLTDE